ncbi:unnamed protein product [Clonostachys byssicola]|uniref:Uncharacterized protein n=1 Tax=Clonostachys byssicola TaxID=160290 RepID=A0A9N9UPI3_9HYPO|nr:unnamed protein product [Clonostachys byssicola]
MHYSPSHIFLALLLLFTTLKAGFIEGRSQPGPTQRIDSPVNAEHGQRDYSYDGLTHDIIEKKRGGDYSFQPLLKRQPSCNDGLTSCGTGCMPENAECCSGKSYCDAGTLCIGGGRCSSIAAASTDVSTSPSLSDFVPTIIPSSTTETDARSSIIIEIIRTITAQPLGENISNSENGTTSTGIIAGATVGGVVAGALAMGGLWFLFRRRKRRTEHQGENSEVKPSGPTPSQFSYPKASQKGGKPTTELDSTDLLEMECHRSAMKGQAHIAELEQPIQLAELDASQYPHR